MNTQACSSVPVYGNTLVEAKKLMAVFREYMDETELVCPCPSDTLCLDVLLFIDFWSYCRKFRIMQSLRRSGLLQSLKKSILGKS